MKTLHVSDIPAPILLVAPHPDDDILGAGGLIQIAHKVRKPIYVLFMTNGDANGQSVLTYMHKPLKAQHYRDFGYIRYRESVLSAKRHEHVRHTAFTNLKRYSRTIITISSTQMNSSGVRRPKSHSVTCGDIELRCYIYR